MNKTARDHALAAFKAGVAGIPMLGGPLSSLIGDYIPTATQRSVNRSIELLHERLDEMSDRIDPNVVNKDEFSELFKTCYLTIVRTHQEAKLKGATSLMANILLKDGDCEKLTYPELDHFAHCLDTLSIGAIHILGVTVSVARQYEPVTIGRKTVRMEFGAIYGRMRERPPDFLMGLLEELNSFHLVHLLRAPTVAMENYNNYPVCLPPIGFRFATSILQLDSDGEEAT